MAGKLIVCFLASGSIKTALIPIINWDSDQYFGSRIEKLGGTVLGNNG